MNSEKTNNYGLKAFDIHSPNAGVVARNYVNDLLKKFRDYYTSLNYYEQPPALISSGIDPTVRLIGSGISTLKHYITPFGEDELPFPGAFIIQKAVRTRNRPYLMDDTRIPGWGSLFNNIVWITRPNRLKEATEETFRFFLEVLKIEKKNLMIRVKSTDHDELWKYAEPFVDIIEIDTKPDAYYTHKLGTDILYAHSYNLALRNQELGSEIFEDIGNIILHRDRNDKVQLVEIGFGDSTILRAMRGIHVIDWRLVPGLLYIDSPVRLKFSDELVTCVELAREGLQPSSKDNRTKLLKAYLHGLMRHQALFGISMSKLEEIITEYEHQEYPENTMNMGKVVTEYLKMLLKKVETKKTAELSPDELVIKTVFEKNPIVGNYQASMPEHTKKKDFETTALMPVINRFNDPVIVKKYQNAVTSVGLWESEKKLVQKYAKTSDSILELGCGTGRVTLGLYPLGFTNIVGVDLAQRLVKVAQEIATEKKFSIKFSCQDARDLKFKEESFETVLFPFNGLMTIPLESNRLKVISEIARVLKSGGICIFTTHDRLGNKSYADFWKKQRSQFRKNIKEPGQHEYGDLSLKGAEDDAFIHIPSMAEVRTQLEKFGLEVIYTRMRSKIATESAATNAFSADCRFWVARKR